MPQKITPRTQKSKIKIDYIKKNLPRIKKTSLNRLAGVVTGARMGLVKQRSLIVKIVPPLIIFLVYFVDVLSLSPLASEITSISSPLFGPIYSLLLSISPFFVKTPYILFTLILLYGGFLWYRLIRQLTGRVFIAFFTLILWLSPFFSFNFSNYNIHIPSQLYLALITYDFSHIVGLSLAPLPIFYLIAFLKKPRYLDLIYAVSLYVLIALISLFAFLNIFIISLVICLSEVILSQGRIKLLRFVMIFCLTVLLCSFWYHPVFIFALFHSPQWSLTFSALANLIPLSFFVIPLTVTILFLVFDRKPQLQSLFIAISLFIIYSLIKFSDSLLTVKNLPSIARFIAEYSLAVSLLAAIIISNLSFFVGLISLKIIRKSHIWLEQIPYLLSSFILGFVLAYTLITAKNNYLFLKEASFVFLDSVKPVIREGVDLTNIPLMIRICSQAIGLVITLCTIVFLRRLKYKFDNQKE